MSVGLLIVTHNRIGTELLSTAKGILGHCPLPARTLDIPADCNPDQMRKQARSLIEELDQGNGVLVLADLYGATPSNIASDLYRPGAVSVVAGVNLPMLLRVLNYPLLGLNDITAKALSGGREGVVLRASIPSAVRG